jgi:hypothetical protein
MNETHLNDGEAFIEGRSAEKARELIEKAKEAGVDPSLIRTTSSGYIVPEELAGEKARTAGEQREDEGKTADPSKLDEQQSEETQEPEVTAAAETEPRVDEEAEVEKAEELPEETGEEPIAEPAPEPPPAGDAIPGPAPDNQEAQFDPADHNIEEVEAYIASADATERERILAAEREGKARKGILGEEK